MTAATPTAERKGKNQATAQSGNGAAPDTSTVANLTIAAAAKIADVSAMTMRNAVKNHDVFKVSGAVVQRKMKDEFGNETEHPATYITRAAVDAYILARKDGKTARAARTSTDPKRRVIRLTDAEVTAYEQKNYALAFARDPKIEAPQTRTKKAKTAATPAADAQPAPSIEAAQTVPAASPDTTDTTAQSTLFDVALTAGDQSSTPSEQS